MNANCISTAYPEKINYYKKRECVHSAYIIDVKHVEYPSQEIKHFTCQFQCLLKKLSFFTLPSMKKKKYSCMKPIMEVPKTQPMQ